MTGGYTMDPTRKSHQNPPPTSNSTDCQKAMLENLQNISAHLKETNFRNMQQQMRSLTAQNFNENDMYLRNEINK